MGRREHILFFCGVKRISLLNCWNIRSYITEERLQVQSATKLQFGPPIVRKREHILASNYFMLNMQNNLKYEYIYNSMIWYSKY